MKKTMFDAIVNAIETMSDCQIDNALNYKELSNDEIKALDELHFFFDELKVKERDAKCKNACKRCTFKAQTLVLNKTFVQCFEDDESVKFKREMLLSKNYSNAKISDKTDIQALLQRVRTAYYESVAQALQDAVEIEFKTKAKKQRNAKDKTA